MASGDRPARLPKMQHYVPRFVLSRFASASGTLRGFDKSSDKEFSVSVDDAAAEKGFYNFAIGGKGLSMERTLASLEDLAAPVIRRVVDERCLAHLSEADRTTLGLFLAVQFLRGKQLRQFFSDVAERVRKIAGDRDVPGLTDENNRAAAIVGMLAQAERLLPVILVRRWALIEPQRGQSFLIGDQPVALFNDEPKPGPYGNLGFAIPTVQVYAPLAKDLTLWLVSPVVAAAIEEGHRLLPQVEAPAALSESVRERYAHLMDGTPMSAAPEVREHLNARQVEFSSRFLYSADGDFELVRRMITANSSYRGDLRPRID
jgi:hypothetical protein